MISHAYCRLQNNDLALLIIIYLARLKLRAQTAGLLVIDRQVGH